MQALLAKIVYQKTKENLDKYFANIFYNSEHKSIETDYDKHLYTVEHNCFYALKSAMYSKVKLHFVRKDFYDYRNRGECITSNNTENTFFNYSFIAYRCNKCNRVVDHINIRFLFEKKIRDNFLYDFFTKISRP